MPSKKAAAEWLLSEVKAGRGDEKCHVVDVTRDQNERIINDKKKTRFVLCTDDPELCSQFEQSKDRIFKKVKNKSLMLTFMIRAWEEALSDAALDRYIAEEEGPQ